jgi:hypothetical protein
MEPSEQYGGFKGKFGLITLQSFWAGVAELLASPLHIELQNHGPHVAMVISRNTIGVEEPAGDMTVKQAAKHWRVNERDPSSDSPPIEIRASFVTNAPADFPATDVNAGDYFRDRAAAFGASGTDDLKVAWFFTYHKMPPDQAQAYLARP